jgi:hypothetical protein
MAKRKILDLLPVLLLAGLASGGGCPNDKGPADTGGDPFCVEPEYPGDTVTEALLLDAPGQVNVYPSFDGDGHSPTLSIVAGALPPGMTFDPVQGTITGTPTELGSYAVLIEAVVECDDGELLIAQLHLEINVVDTCPPLIAPDATSLPFVLSETDCWDLEVLGGLGDYVFTLTGGLPPGILFDPATGSFCGTPTDVGTWDVDVHVEDACPDVQAADIDVEIVVTEPSVAPPPGVYTCALAAAEALWVESELNFVSRSLQVPFLVGAGSNNWGIFNLGQPYFATVEGDYLNDGQPAWGAVPLAGGPDGLGGYAASTIFRYGPGGAALTGWVPANDDFGMTFLLVYTDAALDGVPFDGSAVSGGLCYVLANAQVVRFVEYDPSIQNFGYSAPGIPASSLPGGGPPRSAFGRAGGSVLIVSDGSPGKLFLHDRVNVFTAATVVGDLGNQPLRVRAAGGLFAVSNFADGTLSLGTWSEADVATLTDLATVGDGPFGIDLLDLGDGTVAVASCGFNDDTFSVTRVGADGMEISTTTQPLPAGVEGPGHIVWLRDGSRRLIVGGNATSNLAVLDSGL